jgi:trehalose-phosphatase
MINALGKFFEHLSASSESLLLLDYDGTLAPFRTERMDATPYPSVMPLLEEVVELRRTRVVVVSGRPASEVSTLLGSPANIEIWGSHGLEVLHGDGTYQKAHVPDDAARLLSQARIRVLAGGLGDWAEFKPGGIAIHWRSLPEAQAKALETKFRVILSPIPAQAALRVVAFEAGLEIRVVHPDKGDAVATILQQVNPETPVAYLGDDFTDEDAFQRLDGRGLTVLVRSEYRPTRAAVWLCPPEELVEFLQAWKSCTMFIPPASPRDRSPG